MRYFFVLFISLILLNFVSAGLIFGDNYYIMKDNWSSLFSDYNKFANGDYNGWLAIADWNKISFLDTNVCTNTVVPSPDGNVAFIHYLMNDNTNSDVVLDVNTEHDANASTDTGTLSAAGKINSSLDFKGTDYTTTINSDSLNFGSNDFSISWWYYTNNTSYSTMIARDDSGTYTPFLIGYYDGAGGYSVYMSSDGANFDIANGVSMGSAEIGTWTHYVLERNGNDFNIYKNNVFVNSFSSAASIFPSSGYLRLASGQPAYQGKYDGRLDDVRFYDYALDENQRAFIFNSGNGTELDFGSDTNSLVCHSIFDGNGSGTSFNAVCPVGEVLQVVDSNGTFVCVPNGSGGGNPFDQDLNTTNTPTFVGLNFGNGGSILYSGNVMQIYNNGNGIDLGNGSDLVQIYHGGIGDKLYTNGNPISGNNVGDDSAGASINVANASGTLNNQSGPTFDWYNLKFPTLTTDGCLQTSNSDGTIIVGSCGGGSDTNWETSWSVFDSNMRSQFRNYSSDYIDFNLLDGFAQQEGRLQWDVNNGTLMLGMPGGNVNLQLGQEQIIRVHADVDINNGNVVYITGHTDGLPNVGLADANNTSAHDVIGIATENISANHWGYVTSFGLVHDLNTSAYTPGQELFLSQNAGQLTGTIPVAPAHTVRVGYVIKNANDGDIFVRVKTGFDLNMIDDVNVTGSQLYDLNTAVWQNYNETKDPTGFPLTTGVTLKFYDNNRYLEVCPTSSTFYYLYKGIKVTVTGCKDVQIPDTNGQLNWVYFNDTTGTLKTSTNISFAEDAQVATVYWNNFKGMLGTETHGFSMDYTTHGYLHFTVGARYISGFTGTFNDNNTYSITNGRIYDEDLLHNKAATTNYGRIFYRQPTTLYYTWDNNSTSFYKTGATNKPVYDNSGTLTEIGNGNYVAYWIFASPDDNNPIVSLVGQREDSTLTNAQANATYESLSLGTLPSPEMKLLYRVIVRLLGTNITVANVTDYRTVSNLPSGTYTATSHASLTNLNWSAAGHYFDTNLNVGTYDVNANAIHLNVVWSDKNSGYGTMYCADGNIVNGYLVGYSC